MPFSTAPVTNEGEGGYFLRTSEANILTLEANILTIEANLCTVEATLRKLEDSPLA